MLLPIPLVLAAGKKIPRSFYFHTLARRSLKKKIDGLSQASKCCNNIRILKKFIIMQLTYTFLEGLVVLVSLVTGTAI